MGPHVDAVSPDPDMPAEADVVIIGGGIIGTSAALFLAQRGLRVVLCEKGHIAGRTIEPQLGLGPQGAARPARDPADRREPAAMGADERDGR